MHNSQNGQTHFKNLAPFTARFLKCVWPFWDIRLKLIVFLQSCKRLMGFTLSFEVKAKNKLAVNYPKCNGYFKAFKQ